MNIEIETKLKVESLDEITARLVELGGRLQDRVCEVDSYFDDAGGSLIKSDRGLRLRQRISEANEKIILTYKGPREEARFKSRQEIETELSDSTAMVELLAALGYKKILVFEKKRCLWRMDDCAVCLDELPLLGNFVEIEGPDEEKIAEVAKKLKLSHLPHINESYAILMRDKLTESGSEKSEAFFKD